VPTNGAPPKYAWLGSAGVASESPTGLVVQDGVTYVPQTGGPLQTQGVALPKPDNAAIPYVMVVPQSVIDETAAMAKQLTNAEEAERAIEFGEDIDPTWEMNLKRSQAKADELASIVGIAEILDFLDIPKDLAELAEHALGSIGLDVVFKWFHESAAKLSKCADNHRDLHICRYEYHKREINLGPVHLEWPDFTWEPNVYECEDYGPQPNGSGRIRFCFYEVHIFPWEAE
jgi:hypothetical protein